MIQEIIVMFLLGILSDLLVTLYYIFVGRLQAVPASLMTILVTLLNFFVIEQAVVTTNWMLLVTYALGSAVGCFAIIVFQKEKLKRKEEKQKNSKKKKL